MIVRMIIRSSYRTSLAMFANRMLKFGADSKYVDIVEKTIYNGVMSGVSLDGKSFFYENPLEIDPDFNHVNPSTKQKQPEQCEYTVKLYKIIQLDYAFAD